MLIWQWFFKSALSISRSLTLCQQARRKSKEEKVATVLFKFTAWKCHRIAMMKEPQNPSEGLMPLQDVQDKVLPTPSLLGNEIHQKLSESSLYFGFTFMIWEYQSLISLPFCFKNLKTDFMILLDIPFFRLFFHYMVSSTCSRIAGLKPTLSSPAWALPFPGKCPAEKYME